MQNDINSEYSEPSTFPPPLSPTKHQSPPLPKQQPEPSDGVPTALRSLDDDTLLGLNSPIDDLKKTARFIRSLRDATLEHSNMRQDDINRLRTANLGPILDVEDKHFIKSLRGFLLSTSVSQATYNAWRDLILDCYPDDPFLSFNQMKRHIEQLSGVVPIYHDMCQDTCIRFTGPFTDCEHCSICGTDHYKPDM
jgi:hypothetical protein